MNSKQKRTGLFSLSVVLVIVLMALSFAVDRGREDAIIDMLNSAQTTDVFVLPGDTLYGIASAYGKGQVPNSQLVTWIYTHNNLDDSSLRPGQHISVPVL